MKHLPEITIKVINHKLQNYSTAGNWLEKADGSWVILVSKTNYMYELFVAIHELWEMAMCIKNKIKESDVTNFDIDSGLDDPGLSQKAPYHKEHMQATKIEKLCVKISGEDWDEYEAALNNLPEVKHHGKQKKK